MIDTRHRRFLLKTLFAVTLASGFIHTPTTAGPLSRGSEPTPAPEPVPLPGDGRITFLHLNDLHAHLVSHKDIVRDPDTGLTRVEERGGLARIKTLADEIEAGNPQATLFMNIGDTFHGGVESLYTDGNAIVPAINAMGIDVGVPGNWDFAYGPKVTRNRFGANPDSDSDILRPAYPNLGGNVTDTSGLGEEPLMPASATFQLGNVKVGVIGITSDMVEDMFGMLGFQMDFLQGHIQHLNYVIDNATALRADGCAVVVVMSELGIHKDMALANALSTASGGLRANGRPMVDVFFSAHTHEVTATDHEEVASSGALVVEAGDDTYLGQMDLFIEGGEVIAHQWTLHDVDLSIAEQTQVRQLVDTARAPFLAVDRGDETTHLHLSMGDVDMTLDKPIDAVVGHTARQIDRRGLLENSFNKAFTELLRSRTGTDIAMTNGFRFDTVIEGNPLSPGEIRVEDAYRFFPMEFRIATARIQAGDFADVVRHNMVRVFSTHAFNQVGGWMDGYAGLEIDVDLTDSDGDGSRLLTLRLKGEAQALEPDRWITVAGCRRPKEIDDTALCSYTGFTDVTGVPDANGVEYSGTEFLIDALEDLERNGLLFANTDNNVVTDISQTPMWPADPYVQPLYGIGPEGPQEAAEDGNGRRR